MQPPARTRVVLAEDGYVVREGLRRLLSETSGLDLVAVVDSLPALEQALAEHSADVLVTEARLAPTRTDEGIRVAERLVAAREQDRPEIGSLTADEVEILARVAGGASDAELAADLAMDVPAVEQAVATVAAALDLDLPSASERDRAHAVLDYLATSPSL